MKLTYGYARVSTTHQDFERQIANIKEKYPEARLVTDKFTGTKLDRPNFTKLLKILKPGDTVVFDAVDRMSRNAEEGFRLYRELYEKGVQLVFLKDPLIDTEVYKGVMQIPNTGNKDLDETLLRGLNEYLFRLADRQIRIAFETAQYEADMKRGNVKEGIREKKERNEELKREFPETYMQHPDYTQIGQPKGAKLTTKKSIAAKEVIRKYNKDFGGTLNDIETMIQAGMLPADYDKQTITDKETGETRLKTIKDYNRTTYYKYKRELKEAGE